MTETIERSVNYMCNLSYGIRLEGRTEGRAEGKAEGRQSLLYELVLDGEITIASAARWAEQTDEEFQNGLNDWLA